MKAESLHAAIPAQLLMVPLFQRAAEDICRALNREGCRDLPEAQLTWKPSAALSLWRHRSVHGQHCLPAELTCPGWGCVSWDKICCCWKSVFERPALGHLAQLKPGISLAPRFISFNSCWRAWQSACVGTSVSCLVSVDNVVGMVCCPEQSPWNVSESLLYDFEVHLKGTFVYP